MCGRVDVPPTGSSEFGLRKSHSPQSNYALRLEGYFKGKFGQVATPIAMLKTLAIISSKFDENTKLWVLNVAPSRHLKTQTTQDQTRIFPANRLVYLGSDFTIHGLIRDYDSGRKIDGKCVLINDMTLLLASKAKQTRSRLIDAFSELASEGLYIYRDFQQSHVVRARFSLNANITPHSFFVNREQLLGNTFIERCLVVYHALSEEEMSDANLNREQRVGMRIEKFRPLVRERDVTVTNEDLARFNEYAKRWRLLDAYSSSSSLFDMIKSVAVAHVILSGNRRITDFEYTYLDTLEPYMQNPDESVKLTMLQLAHQGKSIEDICLILNRDYRKYRPFVSRTLSEYRRKGILPWTRSAAAISLSRDVWRTSDKLRHTQNSEQITYWLSSLAHLELRQSLNLSYVLRKDRSKASATGWAFLETFNFTSGLHVAAYTATPRACDFLGLTQVVSSPEVKFPFSF